MSYETFYYLLHCVFVGKRQRQKASAHSAANVFFHWILSNIDSQPVPTFFSSNVNFNVDPFSVKMQKCKLSFEGRFNDHSCAKSLNCAHAHSIEGLVILNLTFGIPPRPSWYVPSRFDATRTKESPRGGGKSGKRRGVLFSGPRKPVTGFEDTETFLQFDLSGRLRAASMVSFGLIESGMNGTRIRLLNFVLLVVGAFL